MVAEPAPKEVELPGRGAGPADDVAKVEGPQISMVRLVFSCMVAGGIQYGWALQLSLLTPYVQTLGLSHAMSSLMWLCGPIAGFVVQPFAGLYSDRCQAKLGRRRPFILGGCLIICISVVIIGFSSDIGYALGDTIEDCSVYHGPRWKAAIVFVAGFWVLDFSNNAAQGPARALMADLSGHHGCNAANAIFASWMAFGNILGYSSGSTGEWHNWFPFLRTKACCEACANLKAAFLIAVIFLLVCLSVTVICAQEVPYTGKGGEEENAKFLDIFKGLKNLPPGMPAVLFITGLTWLSWFPFFLFNTDWMGREVFHGDPHGNAAQKNAFDKGVRTGAFGLLLNSVLLAIGSFLIEPMCRKFTARIVWATSNFMLCMAMAATTIISVWSLNTYNGGVQQAIIDADGSVKTVALVLFTALGIPLAVLYSVPFAVTATVAATEGGGQGLCTGVLNISIVVPQVIVALGAGPWDQLFNRGNLPAFALASAIAFVSGCLALLMLPNISKSSFKASVGGMH